MIIWLENHYKLITGIALPIIIAIIGLFKIKTLIKKKNILKGCNNKMVIADGSIETNQSFNDISQSAGQDSIQVGGNFTQNNSFDMKSIQLLAQSYNQSMYPYAEKAFGKFRLNAQSFLTLLNSQLEQLSQDELDKFSEADVQMALHNAIQGAGRTNSAKVHEILGRLIADRVQKPKQKIVELAINESIEVAAKLDGNLIKMLGFSFLFSRTKYMLVLNQRMLAEKLILAINEFKNLDITSSKFEYLEAISCGKVLQFISNGLVNILLNNYPNLFLKKITSAQIDELGLPISIQNICFIKNDNVFHLNEHIGLYLFEDAPIKINGLPFTIQDESIKNNLKLFLNGNRMSEVEAKEMLVKISGFDHVLNVWDQNGFNNFSLTAVGIAIGRAYLEQQNFGSYDINVWIK